MVYLYFEVEYDITGTGKPSIDNGKKNTGVINIDAAN